MTAFGLNPLLCSNPIAPTLRPGCENDNTPVSGSLSLCSIKRSFVNRKLAFLIPKKPELWITACSLETTWKSAEILELKQWEKKRQGFNLLSGCWCTFHSWLDNVDQLREIHLSVLNLCSYFVMLVTALQRKHLQRLSLKTADMSALGMSKAKFICRKWKYICYRYCSKGVKYHLRARRAPELIIFSLRTIPVVFHASKLTYLQRC